MRLLLLASLIGLGMFAAPGFADTVVVERIQADNSHNFLLKRILEKVGGRLLRALVIDTEGHETHLYITAEDAIEIKRGLWVLRPGTYQTEI